MPVLHHRVVQPLHSEYSCRLGGPQHLSELRRGRPLRFQARACLFILLVRRKQCGFFDYFAEDSAAVDLDVDGFPALEIQVSGVFAGYLGPDVAPVFQGQLDTYLEPEVDEVVDRGLGGSAVGAQLDFDVVRTDVGVSQAVHGPDKAHDELVCGPLVEVLWTADLLYLAMVHKNDVVRHLHRLFLVVGDQDGRYPDVFVQPAKPSPKLLSDPGVEGAEWLVQQEDVRLDSEGARQGHPLALAS